MIKILPVQSGLLSVNTYFLIDETNKKTVIIDSGENFNLIDGTAKNLGVKIIAVLLTHAHFDHSGNCKKLQDTGVKIYASETDAKKLLNDDNLAKSVRKKFEYLTADVTFKDGDVLDFGEIKLKVISTPGHTDGSCCFLFEDMLFTGDTLFFDSVGRTDLPFGNFEDLKSSIKKLFNLKGDYKVFPGHGEFTTLDRERKYNFMAKNND